MRRFFTAAATLAAFCALSGAAQAVTWYSASNPLTVYQDGVAQGQGYGNFYNENGTHARSNSTQRDNRPGGDGIYIQTDYFFYYDRVWHWAIGRQTARTYSSTWVNHYTREPLHSRGEIAKGFMTVLEDNPFGLDPKSDVASRQFNY